MKDSNRTWLVVLDLQPNNLLDLRSDTPELSDGLKEQFQTSCQTSDMFLSSPSSFHSGGFPNSIMGSITEPPPTSQPSRFLKLPDQHYRRSSGPSQLWMVLENICFSVDPPISPSAELTVFHCVSTQTLSQLQMLLELQMLL